MIKVYEFSGSWCQPCRTAKPIWEKFKALHPECDFEDVDVDMYPKKAKQYGVMSIPNFVSENSDGIMKRYVGLPTLDSLEGLL